MYAWAVRLFCWSRIDLGKQSISLQIDPIDILVVVYFIDLHQIQMNIQHLIFGLIIYSSTLQSSYPTTVFEWSGREKKTVD